LLGDFSLDTPLEAGALPPLVIPSAPASKLQQLESLQATWEFFRWALISFIVVRTIVLAELITLLVLFELTDRAIPGAYEAYLAVADMTVSWDGTLAVIGIVAFFFAAIMLAIFIYRGLRKLETANVPTVTMSPIFGAIGGIIPFAAWFVPFAAIRQIWRGANDIAKRQDQMPVSLFLWWTAWIVGSLLGLASPYVERAAESDGYASADSFRNVVYVNIATAMVFIVSSFFLLRVARRIMRAWDAGRAFPQQP
jgi:hypothetical protein